MRANRSYLLRPEHPTNGIIELRNKLDIHQSNQDQETKNEEHI